MNKITKVSEQVDYSAFTVLSKDLGLFQVRAEIWSMVTPQEDSFDHDITEICLEYSIDNKQCKRSGFKELYEKLYGEKSFFNFEKELEHDFGQAYFKLTSFKN